MNTNKLPYTIKNYWINIGASFLIATIANLIIGMIVGSEAARFLYLLLLAYWILIEIRRFHDANKSGWFTLLNLIPAAGMIIALVVAGTLKSDYDNNRWYEACKNGEEQE